MCGLVMRLVKIRYKQSNSQEIEQFLDTNWLRMEPMPKKVNCLPASLKTKQGMRLMEER